MVFWTSATWIITPLAIIKFGFNGVAFSSFLISTTSLLVFVISKRYINYSFFSTISRQFVASIAVFVFIMFTKNFITSFPLLFLHGVIASIIYLLIVFVLARNEMIKTSQFIYKAIRS